MTELQEQARQVATRWSSQPKLNLLGDGHIHDTFLVEDAQGGGSFVLQRVNTVVYTDPGLLNSQLQRTLAHWQQAQSYACPDLLADQTAQTMVVVDGQHWRAMSYVAGVTVDPPRTTEQVYLAARAFADFQVHMRTLPGPPLQRTIEGFLDLPFYLKQFAAVESLAEADWRHQVTRYADLVDQLSGAAGHIHGDCKVNNLLFAEDGHAVRAVLDFDTTMWGPLALDAGDLMRSVGFSRGGFQLEDFRAVLRGFHDGGATLSVQDATCAPMYVTFMLALRFLTDHLQGDVYFRVVERGQNLHRAREQWQLLEDMARQREAMAALAGEFS
ncbi:MAG: aminoglycoside phosphotransferase family protein [Pseudomonadota bacterium]